MPQVRPNGSQEGNGHNLFVGEMLAVRDGAQPAQGLSEAEKAALYWVGTFHHMHSEAPPYIPIRFKLTECPQRGDDGRPVKRGNGQPASARYVWEVAVRRSGKRPRWYFILWGVDDYSLRIKECRTQREAMALYEKPASYVLELKAPGVRLRKEFLPSLQTNTTHRA